MSANNLILEMAAYIVQLEKKTEVLQARILELESLTVIPTGKFDRRAVVELMSILGLASNQINHYNELRVSKEDANHYMVWYEKEFFKANRSDCRLAVQIIQYTTREKGYSARQYSNSMEIYIPSC